MNQNMILGLLAALLPVVTDGCLGNAFANAECGMRNVQEDAEGQRDDAMAVSLKVTLNVSGDRMLFERTSERLRNTRPLLKIIGEFGVSQAQERLTKVLKPDSAVRTGNLPASLTVFEVTNSKVVYGSNLVYAAQVHFGGTILPRDAKALAIPLLPALQRQQLSPRDLDPNREFLKFIPYTGSKPNVFGLLINPKEDLTGRQRKARGRLPGYPPGPLFALAYWVTQKPRPYLFLDEDDQRTLREEIWPDWLSGG